MRKEITVKAYSKYITSLSLLLIPAASVMNSCGPKSGHSDEGMAAFDTVEMTESIPLSPISDPEEKEDEEPLMQLPTGNQQIDYMQTSGHWDKYSSGILPQMAEEQPDYCEKLLNNTHEGFIVVDKARMVVVYYDRFGNPLQTYGMACAKNYGTKHKRGDSRTPEGFFAVEGVYDSSDWLFTDDNGVTSEKKGQFGPRFIRLAIPGISSIGIHGTCAPWSIGGRSSHGCIRLTNENILKLVKLVEKGMPVIVSPGTRDLKVNAKEGYHIPSITSRPGGKRVSLSDETVKALREEGLKDGESKASSPGADKDTVRQPETSDSPEVKEQAPQTPPSPPAEPEEEDPEYF